MMRRGWMALAALGVGMGAGAQTHVVKKPETVVRAVGVYEWTGEEGKPTASRLVPVTLFIDGHLEDAGVYLSRPVPFALGTGTIFELDQAGVPEGTLEVSFARHLSSRNGDFDNGWMGFGPYKELPKPKLVAAKKSGPLSKIEQSGGKPDTASATGSGPKFAKKPDATTTPADDSGRPTMRRKTDDSTAGASASKDTTAASTDDPDRPTMKRKPDADSTTSNANKTPDDSDPSSDVERPTLRKRTDAQRKEARKEHDTSSVRGVGSLNDDPDRPNLHRGKSAGNMSEDDLPALIGLPADMHQKVAVSDAVNRPEHNFARAWLDDAERVAVTEKLRGIAREKVAAYDKTAVAVVSPAPAPAPAPATVKVTGATPAVRAAARKKAAAAARAAAPASAAMELKDEVVKGYTLSYGGAATYFYSATVKGADGLARFVAVVAQQEQGFDLRVALASVTDEHHLDRTPQYRLVDVVDVEASNRASLLMELRAERSRQFALYRVIGAQAQQTFLGGTTE